MLACSDSTDEAVSGAPSRAALAVVAGSAPARVSGRARLRTAGAPRAPDEPVASRAPPIDPSLNGLPLLFRLLLALHEGALDSF